MNEINAAQRMRKAAEEKAMEVAAMIDQPEVIVEVIAAIETRWCKTHNTQMRDVETDNRTLCWYMLWARMVDPTGVWYPCDPQTVVVIPDRRQS